MKNRKIKDSIISKFKKDKLAEKKKYRNYLFLAVNNLENNLLDEKAIYLKNIIA